MPTQIWRFFFQISTPPPTEFANAAPPENFPFGPLQAILREKRGAICQGLQLVECSSNQILAYIMEGDTGAGAREKKGVPNEQKNEPENEQVKFWHSLKVSPGCLILLIKLNTGAIL